MSDCIIEIIGKEEKDVVHDLYKILKQFDPESKEFGLTYLLKIQVKGSKQFPIISSNAKSQAEFVEQVLGYNGDCKKYPDNQNKLDIRCVDGSQTYTIRGCIKERPSSNPSSKKEFYIEMIKTP